MHFAALKAHWLHKPPPSSSPLPSLLSSICHPIHHIAMHPSLPAALLGFQHLVTPFSVRVSVCAFKMQAWFSVYMCAGLCGCDFVSWRDSTETYNACLSFWDNSTRCGHVLSVSLFVFERESIKQSCSIFFVACLVAPLMMWMGLCVRFGNKMPECSLLTDW